MGRPKKTEARLLISSLIVFTVLFLNTVVQVTTIIANEYGVEQMLFIQDLS